MKASLKWIKELLPSLKATPAAIEKRLTAVGLEVEGATNEADALAGVVAAEVRSLSPHPNADSLRVAQVFDGEHEHTVVCGAPNVEAGQRVAFAPVGVTLPNGITLSARPIRGVESHGMICSEAELGLSEEHDGILVLKPRTKAGKPLAEVLNLKDVIYELSITPNRPDVLSHFGLARELAAIHGLPQPKHSVRVRESTRPASERAKVEIKDAKRCPKYLGRVITGVTVGPSPSWVQQRLKAVGLRPISNVVDATNIVLLELGHPLHAFDLAKLRGAKIVVRTAAAGERISLLDGTEKVLDPDDLVIADAEVPVALAGVMGGAESEVAEGTTDILLESAWFDPSSVRRSGRRHALHTEASHRFERGADPAMVETAVDRCAMLIVELAGGKIAKGRVGGGKGPAASPVVAIRPERATLVLGRPVNKKEIKGTLVSLGLKAARRPKAAPKKGPNGLDASAILFQVPSWRRDLACEEDLIEEVARLTGYDQIPVDMPPRGIEVLTQPAEPDTERGVRDALVAEGFLETISLAFGAREHAIAMGFDPAHGVYLANPLGEETQLMRMSMVPSLLQAARLNQDNLPSLVDLRLFEIGRTFVWGVPPGRLPLQANRVGMLMRGRRSPYAWTGEAAPVDPFDLKGAIEATFEALSVRRPVWIPHDAPWLHPRSGTRIEVGGRTLGLFGELHPDFADRMGLEGPPVMVAELDVDAIARSGGDRPIFQPLPKLPPAQRDLSFFVDREISAAQVLGVIAELGRGRHLEAVDLFDVYEGQGVPQGKKSLAVAMTFRAQDRTLTDAEIEAAQGAIVEALSGQLGAEIRSGR